MTKEHVFGDKIHTRMNEANISLATFLSGNVAPRVLRKSDKWDFCWSTIKSCLKSLKRRWQCLKSVFFCTYICDTLPCPPCNPPCICTCTQMDCILPRGKYNHVVLKIDRNNDESCRESDFLIDWTRWAATLSFFTESKLSWLVMRPVCLHLFLPNNNSCTFIFKNALRILYNLGYLTIALCKMR